jgi:hypothetical protein
VAVLRELRSDAGAQYLDLEERLTRLEAELFWGSTDVAS